MSAGGYVDAHHHIWDLRTRPQPWVDPVRMAAIARSFSVDDLRAEAAAARVWQTVVVQTVPVPDETPELLAAAADDPLVAGVVGWVDLTAPDVAAAIDALRAGCGGELLCGVRHQVQDEADPEWLDRPAVRRGIAAVAAAGLPFDLLVTQRQLPAAVRAVRDLPHGVFVLDHLGKPPIAAGDREPWGRYLGQLAALPNTYAKVSGLITEAEWASWTVADLAPYVDAALASFGPDRLLWGSDWPVCLLAGSYAGWSAAIDELLRSLMAQERDAVRAGTARRVYRLPA